MNQPPRLLRPTPSRPGLRSVLLRSMCRLLPALLLCLAAPPLLCQTPAAEPARATATPAPAALTPAAQAEVARAEEYLNGIRTLKSRFLQVAPDGSVTTGTFLLSRPGRMRIDYDAPSTNFIVADGDFVYFWDGEAKEQSNAPIGSTLADFLLRPDLKLSGPVTVAAVVERDNALEITLFQTKDPGLGRLTLVFEERPFALRKWRILDAQGLTTEVALQDPQTGVTLDKAQFFFRDPTKRKDRD